MDSDVRALLRRGVGGDVDDPPMEDIHARAGRRKRRRTAAGAAAAGVVLVAVAAIGFTVRRETHIDFVTPAPTPPASEKADIPEGRGRLPEIQQGSLTGGVGVVTASTGRRRETYSSYITFDAGTTFEKLTYDPAPGETKPDRLQHNPLAVGATFLSPDTGWVLLDSGDGYGVFVARTTDGGDTWRFGPGLPSTYSAGASHWLGLLDESFGWIEFDAGPAQEQRATLQTTTDGGVTWSESIDLPAAGEVIFTSPKEAWLAPTSGGPAYHTTDGWQSFSRVLDVRASGGETTFLDLQPELGEPLRMVATMLPPGEFATAQVWELQNGQWVEVGPPLPTEERTRTNYVGRDGRVTASVNGGTWWAAANTADGAVVSTRRDDGVWESQQSPTLSEVYSLQGTDGPVAWAGTLTGMYRTDDYGATWKLLRLDTGVATPSKSEVGTTGGPCGATVDPPSLDPLTGDFDGDGAKDQAWQEQGRDGVTVSVCTASGTLASAPVLGQGEAFAVQDVQGDGTDELWPGGTTVSGLVTNVLVMTGRRLEHVTLAGSEDRLLLDNRPETDSSDLPGRGIGCVDIDGDGRREVVQLVSHTEGETVEWERTAYAIDGGLARLVDTASGAYHSPEDDAKIQLLTMATCGDEILAGDG